MATLPTIKQGSKGVAVTQWQTIIGVTADGNFGPATTTATKTWQATHNLTADGIVGPLTWNAATVPQTSVDTFKEASKIASADLGSIPTKLPLWSKVGIAVAFISALFIGVKHHLEHK